MNCAENMKIANEFTWVPPEDTQRAKVDTKYKRKEQKKEKEKDLHKNHKDLLYRYSPQEDGKRRLPITVDGSEAEHHIA